MKKQRRHSDVSGRRGFSGKDRTKGGLNSTLMEVSAHKRIRQVPGW
jgi:hypothetical protein